MLALRMSVIACSSWPTTTTRDEASSGSANYSTDSGRHSGTTLTDAVRGWPTPNVPNGGRSTDHAEREGNTLYHNGKKVQEGLEATSRNWKTPHGMAGIDHTGKAGGGGEFAAQVERWATPAAQEAGGTAEQFLARKEKAREAGASLGVSLTSLNLQVDNWPSPMARDHKGGGVTTERKDGKSRMDMLDWRAEAFSRPVLSANDGRELSPTTRTLRPRLNPAFAAWLMGLPGWWTSPAVTSCAQSAMEPYRCALRSQLLLLLGERSSATTASPQRPTSSS